jgi:hypothetical protein
MGIAARLNRLRRAIRSAVLLILAVMIAEGTPDFGIAETISISQSVTVLRGQPAPPSDQADQPPPTSEAPNWYPYSYYYPYWWYAGYPWDWGWAAPWVWGWPVGVPVAVGGCFNCRFQPTVFHHHFFHPRFAHRAFVHPGFVRPAFVHQGFVHPGFVHMGFHGSTVGGGFHVGRR